jgi:hypothetical protein
VLSTALVMFGFLGIKNFSLFMENSFNFKTYGKYLAKIQDYPAHCFLRAEYNLVKLFKRTMPDGA